MAKATRKKSRKKKKSKRPSRKPSLKRTESPKTRPEKHPKKNARIVFSLSKKTVAAISVFCGIASIAFLFFPKVGLEFGPSLNPHNPLKYIVYLSNEGYFPIVNIKQKIVVKKCVGTNPNFYVENLTFTDTLSSKIPSNQKTPVILQRVLSVPDRS